MRNKPSSKFYIFLLVALVTVWFVLLSPAYAYARSTHETLNLNHGWQYHLGDLPRKGEKVLWPDSGDTWIDIPNVAKPVSIPKGITTVWYRIKLPSGKWENPSIYFDLVYAQSLSVYLGDHEVYRKYRRWARHDNRTLIPLNQDFIGKTLYIKTHSMFNTFGPRPGIFFGNFDDLSTRYFQYRLVNVIIGCALVILAVFMAFISVFLNRELNKIWLSLCLVTVALGIGEAVYPNNLGPYYPFFDEYSVVLSDIIKFVFFPSVAYFFEQVFGAGYKGLIRHLWQALSVFSLIGLMLIPLNVISNYRFLALYNIFTGEIAGTVCLLLFLTLAVTALNYAIKGNTDARIFTAGFIILAITGGYDVFRYFIISTENPFTLWVWGALAFLTGLLCILGRRLTANYNQIVDYSAALELKNKELDSMWQEIKISRDQLIHLNTTLEERVSERTRQLEVANKELSTVNEKLSMTNRELTSTMEILNKTQAQLIESEKLAALGQLIAGITHEINTPFGAIQASIGNISESLKKLLEELPSFLQKLTKPIQDDFLAMLRQAMSNQPESMTSREERQLRKLIQQQLQEHRFENAEESADILASIGINDIRPHLAIIEHPENAVILKMVYTIAGLQRNTKIIKIAAERTAKVVFALKSYTHHSGSNELVQADIIMGIETVLTLYHTKIKNNVEIVRDYQELPLIWCYPDELNQVWTNIIDNALQAMKNRGTLAIKVSKSDSHIIVSITDNGPGIQPDLIDKIFNPFFTTKPKGEGSGMGLDFVKKIMDKHKGKITVDSIPGKTMFCVYIPSDG